MDWTTDVTIEFLDLYKAEPVIWNPQHEHHKDRNQVYEAWKRIQAIISIQCSVKDLKRKKENLMSTFRKLAGKVKRNATARSGTYDVYKPEWFAYDKMAAFLHDVYAPRGTATNERPKNDDGPDEDSTPLDNEDEACETVNEEAHSSIVRNVSNDDEKKEATEPLTVHKDDLPARKKGKPEKIVHIKQRMDEAYDFLKQVAAKPKIKKGEIQLFCELLWTKLEALDDRKRDFVMHEINILMFNAKNTSNMHNAMPNQPYQQPQHFTNFPQEKPITRNQYQPPAFGSNENSQPFLSPTRSPSPSSSSSSQVTYAVLSNENTLPPLMMERGNAYSASESPSNTKGRVSYEQLIALVQEHPPLYDNSHPAHCHRDVTTALWAQIARQLGTSEGYCKTKWANLRSNFVRELRRVRTLEDGSVFPPQWPLFKPLMFLLPHLKIRGQSGAVLDEVAFKSQDLPDFQNLSDDGINSNEPPKKKIRLDNKVPAEEETDDDKLFMLSLVPKMRLLSTEENLNFRLEVQQLLLQKFCQSTETFVNSTETGEIFNETECEFEECLVKIEKD